MTSGLRARAQRQAGPQAPFRFPASAACSASTTTTAADTSHASWRGAHPDPLLPPKGNPHDMDSIVATINVSIDIPGVAARRTWHPHRARRRHQPANQDRHRACPAQVSSSPATSTSLVKRVRLTQPPVSVSLATPGCRIALGRSASTTSVGQSIDLVDDEHHPPTATRPLDARP